MENDTSVPTEKIPAKPGTQDVPNAHFADYAAQTTSSLVPMLISGLVLIVVGMIVAMIYS
ncbi:MAG: hypothetical protein ACOH12_04145 [Parvibaculaceae bacterium]